VRHENQDRGNWKINDPTVLDIEHLKKTFENVFVKGTVRSHAQKLLSKKLTLRVGMNTDPFQKIENDLNITYKLLELLKEYQYPYVLLTKNAIIADKKYLPLYDRNISYLQVTITSLNAEMSKKIEGGASLPQDRLDAVRTLIEAGNRVAVRINPLFPIYPDGHYSNSYSMEALTEPELDIFTWDLVHRICECRPSTVLAGFLRIGSEKTHRWFEQEANLDMRKYFWKNNHKYYSTEEIKYYYSKCKSICNKYNVPFSICFDRNDNYEIFKDMWANKQDCCNALDKVTCHSKTYQMICGTNK
jgi:DNA repair photolyase